MAGFSYIKLKITRPSLDELNFDDSAINRKIDNSECVFMSFKSVYIWTVMYLVCIVPY